MARSIAMAGVVGSLLALLAPAGPHAQQLPVSREAQVDQLFARWTRATPGCAVGVAREGRTLLEKGYGMADLEHDVPITTRTIFEAGSVAKQFTAAAVLLLAREGRLSLDDPAGRFVPEIQGYGDGVTIRHMLTHTSGLRDWGNEAAMAGWPRSTRVYTQAFVLDSVARQRALNFTPGTHWSYSNTGYTLAAVLVARVSGETFAELCRRRLFEPLELKRTSWRDDHTRVVKDRAIGYAPGKDGYRTSMPFEDVHGNGGLLTTVGDLLRWNGRFDRSGGADADIARQQQEPARLASGQVLGYGLGLYVGRYKGLLEGSHGGGTAGYSAYLARYPEKRFSVALLCNALDAPAEGYGHALADIYLDLPAGEAGARGDGGRASREAGGRGRAAAGLYRHLGTGQAIWIVQGKDGLAVQGGPTFLASSASRLETREGAVLEFDETGGFELRLPGGLAERYERVTPAQPTTDELRAYEGVYASDEAEAEFLVAEKDGLWLLRRPATKIALKPLYADAFLAPGVGTVVFRRENGRVTALSAIDDRVWDLRFRRVASLPGR
jgi:CubicO group peptidase (beta-lactamase class C family)